MQPQFNVKVFEMDEILRTPTLLSAVRRLTISPSSGMNQALNRYEIEMHSRSIKSKAIIAYNCDSEPRAVGWALYAQDPSTDLNHFKPEDGSICFQIYVERPLRRQGIGSKLIQKATELAGDTLIKVYEYDAPAFFSLHKADKKIDCIYNYT